MLYENVFHWLTPELYTFCVPTFMFLIFFSWDVRTCFWALPFKSCVWYSKQLLRDAVVFCVSFQLFGFPSFWPTIAICLHACFKLTVTHENISKMLQPYTRKTFLISFLCRDVFYFTWSLFNKIQIKVKRLSLYLYTQNSPTSNELP